MLPASANLNGTSSDDGLPGPLTLTWSKVSGPGTVSFGSANAASTTATFSVSGTYVLRLTASDGTLSNADDVTITVDAGTGDIPPDPSTVAPPVDRSVASTIGANTAFLYTGATPIESGVAPGTIDAKRAAVLRGRVLDRNGAALSGATITIVDHPEFGQTLSRLDGKFDLAVNGGALLTVNYRKSGFLAAQRRANAPWQDYVPVDDVVLIPLDAPVTTIAANSAVMQVHRGSVSSDADGSRQATLLFPAGTTAQMVLPGGSTTPLASLSVRATEFTVGPNGQLGMPAQLPPNSAYTYAVELSVDEAAAAGATEVRFNAPIPFYLDNFLNFPAGVEIPLGSYDRQRAVWVAADNGRVVKILSIAGGAASLDTDGDGLADDGVAIGVTLAERQQLAGLYSAGKSLWRMPIPHFSPWDSNWPYGPPPDAGPPGGPPPRLVPTTIPIARSARTARRSWCKAKASPRPCRCSAQGMRCTTRRL